MVWKKQEELHSSVRDKNIILKLEESQKCGSFVLLKIILKIL